MHLEDVETHDPEDSSDSLVIRSGEKGYKPVDASGPNAQNPATISVLCHGNVRGHPRVQPVTSNSEHQRSNRSQQSPLPKYDRNCNSRGDIVTKEVVEVSCGKRVTCECIKTFLVQSCSWLNKSDIACLHVAIAEIEAIKPRSVLTNCELKILSSTPSERNITFFSGKGENKFMVFSNQSGQPQFVTRTCPRATLRRAMLSFQYLEWLNVVRVIVSSMAFLVVLFWIFDQLHMEMPIEGCLDVKVKMHETSGGLGNFIPLSKRYCSAPEVGMDTTRSSPTPLLFNPFSSWFKPRAS